MHVALLSRKRTGLPYPRIYLLPASERPVEKILREFQTRQRRHYITDPFSAVVIITTCRSEVFGAGGIRMVIRPAVVGVPRQNGRTAFHAGTGLREFRRELAKIIIERGAHDVVAIGTLLDRCDAEPLQFILRMETTMRRSFSPFSGRRGSE